MRNQVKFGGVYECSFCAFLCANFYVVVSHGVHVFGLVCLRFPLCLRVCVCVYVFFCVYVCARACVFSIVFVCEHIVYMCVYVCVDVYVCVPEFCVCAHRHIHVCVCVCCSSIGYDCVCIAEWAVGECGQLCARGIYVQCKRTP